MSKKILIANRGEIVIRIAKTCRKLDIVPCGIYSDADKNSLHIKRIDRIIDAAKKLDCELIHPGYGFLSENREFTEICQKAI
ncbi:MAG TPA: biotin carboxylase N-terminal domain-containing protein [Candidatus Bathyarchaeia archaeon]|nr:biotin carboxylase N-terminal domain-containing protein [Candidatus Bathyarchaeia archaeon]